MIDADTRMMNRMVVEEIEKMVDAIGDQRFFIHYNAYLLSSASTTNQELAGALSRDRGEDPLEIIRFFIANACCPSQGDSAFTDDIKYTDAEIDEIKSFVVSAVLSRTGIDIS